MVTKNDLGSPTTQNIVQWEPPNIKFKTHLLISQVSECIYVVVMEQFFICEGTK